MNNKIIIIAEAGVNHNGSFELAKKLVDVAEEAGADFVKFQIGKPELLVSKYAPKAEYQQKNTKKSDESQLEMLNGINFPYERHAELNDYCKNKRARYFCTPFELNSIDYLAQLNIGLWKIPSGEITNYPYLK